MHPTGRPSPRHAAQGRISGAGTCVAALLGPRRWSPIASRAPGPDLEYLTSLIGTLSRTTLSTSLSIGSRPYALIPVHWVLVYLQGHTPPLWASLVPAP